MVDSTRASGGGRWWSVGRNDETLMISYFYFFVIFQSSLRFWWLSHVFEVWGGLVWRWTAGVGESRWWWCCSKVEESCFYEELRSDIFCFKKWVKKLRWFEWWLVTAEKRNGLWKNVWGVWGGCIICLL